MSDQPAMPSDLQKLPLEELRSLVDTLIGDPTASRTRMQRIKLTTISAEVFRRLDESDDDAEATALEKLAATLGRWLEDHRRLGENDYDDGGPHRGGGRGPCMCSTARVKH